MADRALNPRPVVLLTGAGFTKNFGGFLAPEMWQLILLSPQVQGNRDLRHLMRQQFDYELLYNDVVEQACSIPDDDEYRKSLEAAYRWREDFRQAVERAYAALDRKLLQFCFRGPDPIWREGSLWTGVASRLLPLILSDEPGGIGFFFTLNQDLLIERVYKLHGRDFLPGIDLRDKPNWFRPGSEWGDDLTEADYVSLPTNLRDLRPSKCNYVKLHGSFGWFNNGLRQMVIGRNKKAQIEREPLLAMCHEWFQQVLSEAKRLLIIGYGFGDDHINEPIARAIVDYGLEVFVIAPLQPQRLKECMDRCAFGQEIWSGIAGLLPYNLTTLFPMGSGGTSPEWEMLERTLLNL